MTTLERGIDHIVLAVGDLEAARRHFANLGFTCTPPAKHPFGTGNSLVQLQNSFIELITVVEPERIVPMSKTQFSFSAKTAEFLEHGEGMAMLVMSSNDARADNEAWAARGLGTFEVVDFSRQAGLPDGGTAVVAFSIAFAVDPGMQDIAFFVCQQHAPQHFWQAAYQRHANGAKEIVSVTLAAAQSDRYADFFTSFLAEARIETSPEQLLVDTPRGRIEVLRPEALEARFAGVVPAVKGDQACFVAVTVTVADTAPLAADFTARGIAHVKDQERILLPAEDNFGLAIEVLPANS